MIKVFNKCQVTSLALQKQQQKNLDTLVHYTMAFFLCNIKNNLGMGKIHYFHPITHLETDWVLCLVNHLSRQ